MPQRYAETTMVYRDEQTGELHGLSRVLCITQDDAHVFCRIAGLKDEILIVWDIIKSFYAAVGFNELKVRLSLHDPAQMDGYLGTEDAWQRSEDSLRAIIKESGVSADEALGEAAFYGPKLDFMATDSIGRSWQVATIQLDFNLPERFDLTCINEAGDRERIVMVHAAIMGSIERFLSVYIEHCAGMFPLWLAPVQVQIIPVGMSHSDICNNLASKLSMESVRVHVDESSETVGKKIRSAEMQKVPYMIVIGDKEKDSASVSVRARGSKDTETMDYQTFLARLQGEIDSKK